MEIRHQRGQSGRRLQRPGHRSRAARLSPV